jgi:hypothetical protein
LILNSILLHLHGTERAIGYVRVETIIAMGASDVRQVFTNFLS